MPTKSTLWTPLFVYRLACGAGAAALYVDGVIIDTTHDFPDYIHTWRALALGAMLGLCGFTFISRTVRDGAEYFILGVVACVFVYCALVVYETSLGTDAALGSVIIMCGATIIHNRVSLLVANVTMGLLIFLGIAAFIAEPVVSYEKYAMSVIAFSAFFLTLMAINLHLRKENQRSEQAANAWFDHSADALIYGDVTNVAELRINEAAAELFGSTSAEVIADEVIAGVLAQETDRDRASIIEEAAGAEELEGTYEFNTASGDTFWGSLLLRRFKIGEHESTLVRITDVSARVAYESALKEAKLKAEAAMEARTRFLANMSHEIRTPMNGVIGMTALVLDSELDAHQRAHIEIIRSSGEALLKIINEILDFSKIDADQVHLETRPFNLEACLTEALQVVAAPAHAKGLELVLDLDAAAPGDLMGDASRIRQVLVNLLSNAVKFTESGHVALQVRTEQDSERGTTLICEVEDTGVGIAPGKLTELFDPFTQADLSTTRQFGGTGLGLTISKRLAMLMGGDITVTSTPQVGSCFRFEMNTSAVGTTTAVTPMETRGKLRALLFESPRTLTSVATLLRQLGVEVEAHSNLDDAAEAYRTGQHEFALLGTHGAYRDAQQLNQALAGAANAVPRVLMTGNSIVDDRDFAKVLGKPLRPSELTQWLNTQFADPDARPVPPSDPHVEQLAELDLTGCSFLLAEDNPVNQKVALMMLKRFGIDADVANNGREAVELLERQAYDVVFMDIQMPEVDGLEASQLIRQSETLSQPYIIAMTANALAQDRENCMSAGMDDFLAKPVRLEDLHSTLVTALNQRLG